ncbi:ComEC/Rec2 family competence protein [Schaalia sp. lx-100]|uniref:ComEC/Rec2 family competence protein n=1 Tax=Schaalia sp. lx-100 TaxID=2899081 RepID=UPI001E29A5F8|nr:ComEC/Rec2 family competence protein [Schaalia sp. lx-100]MCD4556675.1 ComEC/Rec2 family competence protein [Schaalia sp. lx-100]
MPTMMPVQVGKPTKATRNIRHKDHVNTYDIRLFPVAISAWIGSWWGTSSFALYMKEQPVIHICIVTAIVLSILALFTSWRCGYQQKKGRHLRAQPGSTRLALAVVLLCVLGTYIVGYCALSARNSDPLFIQAQTQEKERVNVEATVLTDPQERSLAWGGTYWTAWARSHLIHHPVQQEKGNCYTHPSSHTDECVSSALFILRGSGTPRILRGDTVHIRGRIIPAGLSGTQAVGTIFVSHISVTSVSTGWDAYVRQLRAGLQEVTRVFPAHTRALVPGMSVGDTRMMDEKLRADMRTASLSHLVAISGSHMAIIMGVLSGILPARGRVRLIVCALAAAVMVSVVGPQESLVRSALMTGISLGGMWMNRAGQSLASLWCVSIAMLAEDPWNSRSFAFALSVIATWAVIVPAQRIMSGIRQHGGKRKGWRGRLIGSVCEVLVVSVCCQIVTGPLIVHMTGEWPLWGAVANMCAAPAVAPATLLSLGAAVTAIHLPGLSQVFVWCASIFTGWIAYVAHLVSQAPWARVNIPGGFITCGVFVCGMGIAWSGWLLASGRRVLM